MQERYKYQGRSFAGQAMDRRRYGREKAMRMMLDDICLLEGLLDRHPYAGTKIKDVREAISDLSGDAEIGYDFGARPLYGGLPAELLIKIDIPILELIDKLAQSEDIPFIGECCSGHLMHHDSYKGKASVAGPHLNLAFRSGPAGVSLRQELISKLASIRTSGEIYISAAPGEMTLGQLETDASGSVPTMTIFAACSKSVVWERDFRNVVQALSDYWNLLGGAMASLLSGFRMEHKVEPYQFSRLAFAGAGRPYDRIRESL